MIALLMILLSFGSPGTPDYVENPGPRLSIKIADIKRYCSSDSDFHQLDLKLELIFTNGGSRVLIIEKSILAEITYWRLANTEHDLDAAFWAHTLWLRSGGYLSDPGGTPDENYALLKPGRTYKVRADLTLISKKPLLGTHSLLQVIVPTWSGTEKQAEKLKKKWEKIGVLWFKNVKSEPLPFTVDKAIKVKRCS